MNTYIINSSDDLYKVHDLIQNNGVVIEPEQIKFKSLRLTLTLKGESFDGDKY